MSSQWNIGLFVCVDFKYNKDRLGGWDCHKHTMVYGMDGQWNGDLLYSTGNSTQYSVISYMGKNLNKNGCVYMCN